MPGPPPKHPDARRRRNATVPMVRLPAEGREGDPPAWPLTGKPNKAEAVFWAEVWSTPQAVAWERLGWVRTVARYVRLAVKAEARAALASVCSEARQMEDRLGLTPMSMLRLRWEVVEDELAEARSTTTPDPGVRRLRAVDPAATQTS